MAISKIEQVRLLTGDTGDDEEYLTDDQYQFFLDQMGGHVLNAACEALECIVASLALSPSVLQVGTIREESPELSGLEARLTALKAKRNKGNGRFPIIVKSDRKDWRDFDRLFNHDDHKRFRH